MLLYKRWHVKNDVYVFPVSLISSSLLPVPFTLLSQHSAHWLSTNRRCQSFFTPAASGEWGRGGGGGGCFQLELALMLVSGLWSTQLSGIRATVHLSAALQWNNIPCPTNLHLSSSHLFPSQIHRNLFYYKWKDDYALLKKSNPVTTPFNVWIWISTVKLVSVRNKLMLSRKPLA